MCVLGEDRQRPGEVLKERVVRRDVHIGGQVEVNAFTLRTASASAADDDDIFHVVVEERGRVRERA